MEDWVLASMTSAARVVPVYTSVGQVGLSSDTWDTVYSVCHTRLKESSRVSKVVIDNCLELCGMMSGRGLTRHATVLCTSLSHSTLHKLEAGKPKWGISWHSEQECLAHFVA